MLAAWETYMMLGTDYFHDLDCIGLDAHEITRQAPRVWREHGPRFMAIWHSEYRRTGLPYGAKRWGVPDVAIGTARASASRGTPRRLRE
jgi:hypothetical protein